MEKPSSEAEVDATMEASGDGSDAVQGEHSPLVKCHQEWYPITSGSCYHGVIGACDVLCGSLSSSNSLGPSSDPPRNVEESTAEQEAASNETSRKQIGQGLSACLL